MIANNNKIDLIFLDIDGVLANFDEHLITHNARKDDGKIDHAKLDFNWWASIPVYEGAREFHQECTKIAETKFLTGPMLSSDCFGGKAEWLSKKFLPDKGKRALTDLFIMHSKRKGLLATPNRLLVDDMEDNVKRWQYAGGLGIHHDGDFKKTLRAIKQFKI